jgi:hypothetical protein
MVAAMRFLLTASLLLSACATSVPAAPPPLTAPAPIPDAPSPPSPQWEMLRSAGHDTGPTQAEIVRLFGAPAISRQEGASAALTYRLETCALLMLFEPDARNVQRLTIVHASARRAGAPAPSLEQCAAEATPH